MQITEEENERQETKAAFDQWIRDETGWASDKETEVSDYHGAVLSCSFEEWKKMDVPERPKWE